MKQYEVWYMRPEFFIEGTMGYEWLREKGLVPGATLENTHVHLKDIEARDPEDVFVKMQGENWSPNGEARSLIKHKGLRHTSMSVGDVIVDREQHEAWITDRFGFERLW